MASSVANHPAFGTRQRAFAFGVEPRKGGEVNLAFCGRQGMADDQQLDVVEVGRFPDGIEGHRNTVTCRPQHHLSRLEDFQVSATDQDVIALGQD